MDELHELRAEIDGLREDLAAAVTRAVAAEDSALEYFDDAKTAQAMVRELLDRAAALVGP